MQENSKIIERIQKLLALSGSSNEHEAASALAKAQALLAEHNLSLAQVQARTGVKSSYIKACYDLDGCDNWRRSLLLLIARHNFCEVVMLRGIHMSMVGEDYNIQAVQAMYAFVAPQLERLAASCYRMYQRSGGSVAARTWKNNFFFGALATMQRRLDVEKQAFEAASNACRSLIVVKDRDLREAMQRFHPQARPRHVSYRSAPEGYARGIEAGHQVRLRHEVSQPGNRSSSW